MKLWYALLLILPNLCAADAFQCKSLDGKVIFTDQVCPKGSISSRIATPPPVITENKAASGATSQINNETAARNKPHKTSPNQQSRQNAATRTIF